MTAPDTILNMNLTVFLIIAASTAIFLETVGLRLRRHDLDLRDISDSVLIGLSWAGIRVFGAKALAFAAWVWVWQNLALFEIDLANPVSWLVYWLIGDFLYYWTHRLEHRVRALWCSHLVHHSSEQFNLATAVRQPWTESFYKPVIALWAPLLGFHPTMYVFVGAVSLALGQWQHLEWFPKIPALDRFVMTPSNHRVHHGRNQRYLDRNFGGSLVVWDKLFGSYQVEDEPADYGVLHYQRPRSALGASLGGYPELAADMSRARPRDALRLALGRPGNGPGGVSQLTFARR
jgi:sterol desaturase/sphingolipid hydroxylase (fatty acid hydroxylase superfamily)